MTKRKTHLLKRERDVEVFGGHFISYPPLKNFINKDHREDFWKCMDYAMKW